jgi:hypothetical protein
MDINDKNCFRQEIDCILLTILLNILNLCRLSWLKGVDSC